MDERTEQLINRRLDGEITEEESFELDKLLIRSPEARMYLEEQSRIDALAGDALQTVLTPGDSQPHTNDEMETAGRRTRLASWRRHVRPAVAVAAAIALAMLVASIPSGRSRPIQSDPIVAANEQVGSSQAGQSVMTVPVDDNWSGLPRAGHHEVIGVYDDVTQSLYLLEMSPRSNGLSPVAKDF